MTGTQMFQDIAPGAALRQTGACLSHLSPNHRPCGGEPVVLARLVQEAVARAFDIPVDELRAGTRRTAPVAWARQVAMYLTHVTFGIPLTQVGRAFARDRTTAAHACRRVEDRRDDPAVDRQVCHLEHVLRLVEAEV